MKKSTESNALFQASHMMILVTYTLTCFALIAESILMGWEKWALILIVLAVCGCWYAHIQQLFTDRHRLFIYVICMMATIFFYGIHITSAFDMSLVMCVAIILCTTTGIKFFITLCQLTYFVTFFYDIIYMIRNTPETLDDLVISRIMLHMMLVLVAGWLARLVIDRWNQVLDHSKEEVKQLTVTTGRLNDFLTSVSHEIRTPINAVMGLSGICLERTEDREQRDHLESIRGAGRRMTELISDILDYSDVDRRRLAVNTEDYMLSSVLYDLVAELAPYLRPEVELIIDVDPAIPAMMNTDTSKLKKILWHITTNALKFTAEGGVYMRITSEKHEYGINLLMDINDTGSGMSDDELDRLFDGFYQVSGTDTRSSGGLGLGMAIVSGFVSALNGFVYTKSSPGKGTSVHVSLPQKVVDWSSCMSVNNPDKLVLGGFLHFEKFRDPEVREYYNTMVRHIVKGLGVQMHRVDNLSNLQKLLETIRLTHLFVGPEEYEADVEYMERLAETVTVTVIADKSFALPAASRARVMLKPFYCFPVAVVLNREPGESAEEKFMYCRGVRALVVDDEPLNLTVARDLFYRYGIQVTTAATGQEAIDICARETFDLVFMDHMMPGMDGIEAMRRIRANGLNAWKSIPMVALTANAGSNARQAFRAAGFDGFIAKPIDLPELEHTLRTLLPASMVSFEDTPRFSAEKKTASPQALPPAADEYAPLRELGVDIRQGLVYCQCDELFYQTLLRQFAAEAGVKRAEMEQFFRAEDLDNYTIRVHALKSTAKMIGAGALSEKAKALEEASKHGLIGQVRAGHGAAMAEYEALTGAILSAFGGESEAETDTTAADDEDVLEFGPEEEAT